MKIWKRILLFLIISVCVLVLPWWFSILVIIGFTIYIPSYIEALFFGFLFDTLYSSYYTFTHAALTSAFVLLVLVMFVRSRIRTGKNKNYV